MKRSISLAAGLLVTALLVVSLSGCAARRGRAAELKTGPQAAEPAAAATDKTADDKAKEEAKKEKEEAEKWEEEVEGHERGHAKAVRDLQIAELRVQRAEMALEHARAQSETNLEKAQKGMEMAGRRWSNYLERSVPSRLEWAALGLTRAEDRFKEAKEELEQLELMYAEDDFADGTKEIVLDRGRRRLERSAKDLELRRIDHETLVERTLPLEKEEQMDRLEDARRHLARTSRDSLITLLDHEIGLTGARAEVTRQQAELEAMEKRWEKRVKKHEEELAEKAKEKEERQKAESAKEAE